MDSIYEEVRLWQTHFSIHRPLVNLPVPEMIVEEEQRTSDYRWDGRSRTEDGSQIVITLSGRGAVRIAGKEFELSPGKTFLHNHNDPDICYFYPADSQIPWRFLWFAFYGANSGELVSEINREQGYIFDVPADSGLLKHLKEYKNYAGVIQILPPFEGAMLVYSSLEKLCQPRSPAQKPGSHHFIVNELQNMIAADPAAELQVERLAAHFNVSREHLSRIFCDEAGITLHEYIIRFRLKLALDLLRRTRLSLKEIAAHCGWNDYSNFYRIFIKRFNRSPLEIRGGGTIEE